MLFFREGLKEWTFFMTFDIKGGGGGLDCQYAFCGHKNRCSFGPKTLF